MDYIKQGRHFLKADDWQEWASEQHQTDQQKGLPRAPVQKPYPADAILVDLVPPEQLTVGTAPVIDIIRQRKSRRRYTDQPLTLEELSYLLWATQGVTRSAETSNGFATMRTVPSGGSLHTFETYLFIDRVQGVDPGLYRYLPLEHKLLFIAPASDGLPQAITEACSGQSFAGTAAVVFVWTTIPYRMEWRYDIVAHKIIAQDSGHLCQNLYLAAESIGAGTCAIGAYNQKAMDSLLGVDGEDEFTIYVAPVGKITEKSVQ